MTSALRLLVLLVLTLLPALPCPAQPLGLRLLAAPGFDAAGDAFGGVVPVRRDGLWGLLAADGTWAAEPQFDQIGTPGKGRLPVLKDGLWGVVDAKGRQVTPFAFQAIGQIADWTPMRWKGQWWAFGPDGAPEGQPLPFDALIGNAGTCMVGLAGGVPIAVNRGTPAAATMLSPKDEMRAPSEGFVPIRQGDREGHLDCAWGTIVGGGPAALSVRGFAQGRAALQGAQGWGFATVFSNQAEIGGTWAAAGDFSEGLAAIMTAQGGWGFIRANGQIAIAPRFQEVGPFSDGMAPARADGGWGFISRKGNWLVPPQFQAVKASSQGLAAVEQGGKWGVIGVPPWQILAQSLPRLALPFWPKETSPSQACPSHILPPATAILTAPGAGLAETLPEGQALGICLGDSQSGWVQVLKAGQPLGWVPATTPIPLR